MNRTELQSREEIADKLIQLEALIVKGIADQFRILVNATRQEIEEDYTLCSCGHHNNQHGPDNARPCELCKCQRYRYSLVQSLGQHWIAWEIKNQNKPNGTIQPYKFHELISILKFLGAID